MGVRQHGAEMVVGKLPAGVEGGIKDAMPDSAGLGRRHIACEPPVGQASDSVVLTCTRTAHPDVKGTFGRYRANPQFVVSVEPPVASDGFAGPKPSNKPGGPLQTCQRVRHRQRRRLVVRGDAVDPARRQRSLGPAPKRPMLAICFATSAGCRPGRVSTLGPSLKVHVPAAITASATTGSIPGPDTRSVVQRLSKPRSSTVAATAGSWLSASVVMSG
jgi:hypothetical protein